MMKKTDKQTLDMLRNEFSKSTESVQVPLRLQKESMVTMLKNSDAKTKDFSSKTGNKRNNAVMIRRIAMAAAVFAVVTVAVLYANQGDIKVTKTDSFYNAFNMKEPVKGAKSYSEIEKAVKEIRNIKSSDGDKKDPKPNNTLGSTNPEEQAIVGGYNEYVAQANTTDNDGLTVGVMSDPTPGNHSENISSADIVKTDGEYIYILTTENDPNTKEIIEKIKVVKADPANEIQVVHEMKLSGGQKTGHTESCIEIYLKGDTLIVLMAGQTHQSKGNSLYNEKTTIAVIYDISDPTAPAEIRRHVQDGEYISSGLFENQFRLITKKTIPEFSEDTEVDLIPSFTVNNKETHLNAEEIFIAVNDPDASYLFATVTDISAPDAEPGRLAILGAGKDVYNLTNAFVIARGFVSVEADKNGVYGSLTEICRFDINGTSIGFVESYVIEGSIMRGHAVDEYNGCLRIATDQAGTHTIHMFDEKMGFICNIAVLITDEKTDSVKFIGNKAYFSGETENGDEIWLVDISNPNNREKGSKLPTEGYVQMLSPVSENVLLGITVYPDDKSATGQKCGYFLCDVSDAKNPVIISKYELSDGYSYPMTEDGRHTVLDTERKLFASPVRYTDVSSGKTSSIYLVFDISQNEFNDIGLYEHVSEDGMAANRCVIADEEFYTVSGSSITAFSMKEQSKVSSVKISLN